MRAIRSGLCHICGEVALAGIIVLAQLGPDHHHEPIHVRHPDHMPEGTGYRPTARGPAFSVGSNAAPAYYLQEDGAGRFQLEDGSGFMVLEGGEARPSLTVVWPPNDD